MKCPACRYTFLTKTEILEYKKQSLKEIDYSEFDSIPFLKRYIRLTDMNFNTGNNSTLYICPKCGSVHFDLETI